MFRLITILFDGVNSDFPFLKVLKKLPRDSLAIVNIPSYDYSTDWGIHVSPSLNCLLNYLIPSRKRIGKGFNIARIFKKLNFMELKLTDFELAISLLMTIWLRSELPLVTFFQKLASSLNIRYKILPLLDPPPLLVMKGVNGTRLDIYQVIKGSLIDEIKEIYYHNLDKSKIVEETKNILEESEKILLFSVSPLSIFFLRSIGSLKKMLEKHKGTIIYLLPRALKDLDKKILSILDYSNDLYGLVRMSYEQVDAVIFDEKQQDLISELSDLKITFYPASYEFESANGVNVFVENVLKILLD